MIDKAESTENDTPQHKRTDVRPLTDDLKRSLSTECDDFCRYLTNDVPGDSLKTHYAEAARVHGLAFKEDFTRFDRATLALALKHKTLARWVDAYCALFHRRGALRRKLILLSALLEHTAPSNEIFDHAEGRGALRAVANLALHGASFAVSLVLGTLVLLPIGVICLSTTMASGRTAKARPQA